MNTFPPFEAWLEAHKWGPLPSGMRPIFREGYRAALRDVADALRKDGLVAGALHVERGLASMDAAYPPLPPCPPPAECHSENSKP